MQSRTRKNLRCENDCDAIIRQLQNDFQVFEYLKENKLETINIEEYARLYNGLIAQQQERKGSYYRLQAEFQNLKEKRQESDQEVIQKRLQALENIQQKTCKEMEISNDLEKEIIQTKKSLNLLKGDIGHLVSRNESAKLLSSKISKVKIVAQDQLKRVTLAYIKDKEEIKLRNQMQKKFSKKLKNVSNYENSSLTRLKKNYAEIQLKKKDIFEKLLASQKINENQEEAEMLKQLKWEKDEQNQKQVNALLRLALVTEEFTIAKLASLAFNPNDLVKQITAFFLSLPQLVSQSEMDQQMGRAVEQILDEYHKVEESIKAQSQFYQQLLIIKKENKEKLAQFEKQEGELANKYNLELEDTYKIDEQSQNAYQFKLKQFGQVLGTLFVLLSYLEKNIIFNNSYPLKHKFFSYEKEEEPKNERKSLAQTKQQPVYYNYISCLHRVNHLLSSLHFYEGLYFSEAQNQQQMNEFYGSMLNDVKQWFCSIKQRFTEKYIEGVMETKNIRCSVSRHSIFGNSRRTTHFKKESSSFQQDQQDIQQYERQEVNYLTDNSNGDNTYTKSPSATSMAHSTGESTKAKRIKLLEGIDADYYKMIKSTIKMEKENTRKNYQFLRTFKRAKYASRDNILQEKRFQSSFSVLFTKQSVPNLSKTSKFDNASTLGSKFTENITKNRSFFKKPTNHFLTQSGTNSPVFEGRCSVSKNTQEAANRRSRMAQKLKLAMQFM